MSTEQRHGLEHKRQRLAARVREFHTIAIRLLGASAVSSRLGREDDQPDGYISDDLWETSNTASSVSEIENTALVFPSSISGNQSEFLVDFRHREMLLRRAKANEALARLRETLSGLSYQYINKVRQATSTQEHLRSYKGIKLLTIEVSFYQQVYNKNRSPLIRLEPELATRYPYLRRDECRISTAVADVNARGQSQARLSWFWGALDGYDKDTAEGNIRNPGLLLECEWLCLASTVLNSDESLVYRVNWLRARAQRNRWMEELPRTQREMMWTTLYFMHHRNLWYSRLQQTMGQSILGACPRVL